MCYGPTKHGTGWTCSGCSACILRDSKFECDHPKIEKIYGKDKVIEFFPTTPNWCPALNWD